FTGTLTYAVYRESATGFLDFLYQYHATSHVRGDAIEHLTTIDFGKVTTNVTELSGLHAPTGFTKGTVVPNDATRSGNGEVVAFDFTTPNGITPGQTSRVLVIHTNATATVPGATNVIDGAIATVPTLGPRNSPEPATLTLFGGGLLGLAGSFFWR